MANARRGARAETHARRSFQPRACGPGAGQAPAHNAENPAAISWHPKYMLSEALREHHQSAAAALVQCRFHARPRGCRRGRQASNARHCLEAARYFRAGGRTAARTTSGTRWLEAPRPAQASASELPCVAHTGWPAARAASAAHSARQAHRERAAILMYADAGQHRVHHLWSGR